MSDEDAVVRIEAARLIAGLYKDAPCFTDLLGEYDPEAPPCTCPTCGHRAILRATERGPTTEGAR